VLGLGAFENWIAMVKCELAENWDEGAVMNDELNDVSGEVQQWMRL